MLAFDTLFSCQGARLPRAYVNATTRASQIITRLEARVSRDGLCRRCEGGLLQTTAR